MLFLAPFHQRLSRILIQVNSNSKKYSIVLLSVLITVEIGFIVNGQWIWDFWEHCAVLKELIREPFHPQHPVILSNTPHAFFSPYLVLLGMIGNLITASPITLLEIAAVFNLFLWLYGLFLFTQCFFPDRTWTVYFYLLLFHLFFWGPFAWRFSSFFHFNTLHFVLPYPSTFSTSLAFITCYWFLTQIRSTRSFLFALVPTFLNSIILLTHPTTFLFTFTFVAACWAIERNWRTTVISLMIVALPFVLALAWVYYPFYDLFHSSLSASLFHFSSQTLYELVPIRIAPALLACLIISRESLRTDKRIMFFLAFLVTIYVLGWFTQKHGYGRTISFIVLALHLILAGWLSRQSDPKPRTSWMVVLLILSCLPFQYHTAKTLYTNIPYVSSNSYEAYKPLQQLLSFDDVVMADEAHIRFIPAFGGRVTASIYPPYWISDNEERLRDLSTFFGSSSVDERNKILNKYHTRFVLLDLKNKTLRADFVNTLRLKEKFRSNEYVLLER